MAFTALHVAKVMLHLNYPATEWAKTTITNALGSVSALSVDIENQAIAIITELDAVRAEIANYTVASAGVQVETTGVVRFPTLAIAELKSRYRNLQSELATLTSLQAPSSSSRVIQA